MSEEIRQTGSYNGTAYVSGGNLQQYNAANSSQQLFSAGKVVDYGMSEKYAKFGDMTNQLFGLSSGTKQLTLAEQVAKLPRCKDGSLNIALIKKALQLVIEYQKAENKKALDIVESYGLYAKMVNGENGYAAMFLGPEVNKLLRENNLLGEDVANALKENDSNAISWFPTHDSGDGKGLDLAAMKSSQAIKKDVNEHNQKLDSLLKSLDNLNENNIVAFLNNFQTLTGTSFDAHGIIQAHSDIAFGDMSEGEVLDTRLSYFGESVNYVNAVKNETATYAAGHGVMTSGCAILAKAGPVGRIIANAIPLYVNIVDRLTQNTEEGQWINMDNVNWESVWEVNAQTMVDCGIINIPAGQLKNILSTGFKAFAAKMGINLTRNATLSFTSNSAQRTLEFAEDTTGADKVDVGLAIADPTGTLLTLKQIFF